MIPEIFTAAADVAVAVENGVAMRRNNPPEPPSPPTASATGMSGPEFLLGMAMVAAAVLALAVAMVASCRRP